MSKYSKIDPDYLYLNEAALQSEPNVFMTADPKVRMRKHKSASLCATLAVFLLFLGVGVITFFYIAPMMKWHSYHSTYHYSHHGSGGSSDDGSHDNSPGHHGYPDKEPYRHGFGYHDNDDDHPERPDHHVHFMRLFLDFMHGLSFRGRMCLRSCFREHGECLPGDDVPHPEPIGIEDTGSRERRLWELMLRRTKVQLDCLERCKKFAFFGESDTDTDSNSPDTPKGEPRVPEKHWMIAKIKGQPLMQRHFYDPRSSIYPTPPPFEDPEPREEEEHEDEKVAEMPAVKEE